MLSCFKTYDIRGILGDELNPDIAYRIGRAYACHFAPKTVVVGGDARQTSEALKAAVANGLIDGGANVIDSGLTGTEEIYFAAFHLPVDGGIQITASHNPINYNGMKLVRHNAQPVSRNSGLNEIQQLAETQPWKTSANIKTKGKLTQLSLKQPLVEHYLSYIEPQNLSPLHIVINAGNGAAGPLLDVLEATFKARKLPIRFTKICHQPDATFPNGIPNPLLPENRAITANAVIEAKADFGIAWDGDFDRCFFFDEQGQFIEGYYMVGLLAEAFLAKHANASIIHDPRLYWGTVEAARKAGGRAVASKTGHAFIKERMREENAVFGGEMSAHYYFRDFAYCDSGMIPWLLIAELMCQKRATLSSLVNDRMAAFPSSGEINFTATNAANVTDNLIKRYQPLALKQDNLDGVSLEFEGWRFNLRQSNTEPLLRLNVESKNNAALMRAKTQELTQAIAQEIKQALAQEPGQEISL